MELSSAAFTPSKQPQTTKRLFTSLSNRVQLTENTINPRNTKTSKAPRTLPHLMKGNSLDSSKENLSYEGYLLKVNSATKIDEKSIVSSYLNSLRKEYDCMAKNSRQQQMEIRRIQKQMEFMKRNNQSQKALQSSFSRKLVHSSQEIKVVCEKHENVKMETKILNHIIARMKKDEIFHKNYMRVMQAQASNRAKLLKQKNESIIHEDENLQKISSTLQKMKTLYDKNQSQRQEKYENYCQKIECLQDKDRFIQERKQRTYELLSIQLNDTHDTKNIVARQVYIANKVCDSLLELRITNLLKQYKAVQNSFHSIKTKTSISDPTMLAQKFFSYGELSENLMKSIYTSEMQLEQLVETNKQLEKKCKEGQNRNCEEYTVSSDNEQDFNEFKKRHLEETRSKQLLQGKIKQWVGKYFKVLNCKEIGGDDSFPMKFRSLCAKLKEDIAEFESKQKLGDRKYIAAGVRIKKLIKEISIEEETIRKTETHEMNESIETENKFISESRSVIKKNYQNTKMKGNIPASDQ